MQGYIGHVLLIWKHIVSFVDTFAK
jgi:hypothetical protein